MFLRQKDNRLITTVSPTSNLYLYGSGNILFHDRFDGTLASWTTSGTVAIVTVDNSTKMKLTNASGTHSAKYSFTQPSHKYLIEFDLLYSAGNGVSAQLLDVSNNVIATVDCGLTANTLSFDTDAASPTTKTFTEATYNQIVLCVDPVSNTIDCYWIDKSYSASGYNPLQLVASKAYSGTVITSLKFITDASKTGYVYVDEFRIYYADWAIVGDSISDGKSGGTAQWSSDPSTSYRTGASNDKTSPPQYQLGTLLGSNNWVGSRGWGGSRLSQLPTFTGELIANQGFQRCVIISGINSLHDSDSAATMEGYITSTVAILLAAGIKASCIYIANVYGSTYLDSTMNTVRGTYNTWLSTYCSSNGYNLVDLNATMSTTPSTNSLNAAYDSGDGIHPNKTGYGVMAGIIYSAAPQQQVYLAV
jgi:lysophospholipase L1-like esterase